MSPGGGDRHRSLPPCTAGCTQGVETRASEDAVVSLVQLAAAPSSIVLNLGEAEGNDGGTGRARLFSAAGSNREVRAALELAVAWGYVSAAQVEPLDAEFDRVAAMLYRLTHGRGAA